MSGNLQKEHKKSLGIYLHIPFCKSRCIYCDFISSIDSGENRRRYVKYLLKQIEAAGEEYGENYCVDTLYFGGGTPTLLDNEQFAALTEKIFSSFDCDIQEFTVEANPCTVDREKLLALKGCNVNRLSFGVQSFDDKLLKMLGRRHNATDAKNAIELAKNLGFEVSVDAMIGLPNQSTSDIREFVEIADGMGVNHISVYMLSVEKGTVLDRRIKMGDLIAKSDDEIAEFYEYAYKCLKNKGYQRYEISNFCKDDKKSLHNLRYWCRADYLGLGMGAHSLIGEERWRNAETFEEYFQAVESKNYRFDLERMSEIDREREYIMLNFRLSNGINLTQFSRIFNCDFLSKYKNAIEKHKNHLQIKDNNISIKNEFLQLMNGIIVDFI